MGQKRIVYDIPAISEKIPDCLVGESGKDLYKCEIEAAEEGRLVVWPNVYQLVDNERSNLWELRCQA